MPGDAVCALEGGGGTEGLGPSLPPALKRKRINAILYCNKIKPNLLIDPTFLLFVIVKGRFFTKTGFDGPWGGRVAFLPPAADPRTTGSGGRRYKAISIYWLLRIQNN